MVESQDLFFGPLDGSHHSFVWSESHPKKPRLAILYYEDILIDYQEIIHGDHLVGSEECEVP